MPVWIVPGGILNESSLDLFLKLIPHTDRGMNPRNMKPLSSWRMDGVNFPEAPSIPEWSIPDNRVLRPHESFLSSSGQLVERGHLNTKTERICPTKPEQTGNLKGTTKEDFGSLGRFLSNPPDYSEVKLNLNSFNYPTQIEKKKEAEKKFSISVCWLFLYAVGVLE